ncbi:MAG: UDP-3-O-acyl-N-acetylglucosamine deacetylase, partial [Pseudomonadota bacterium]
MQTTLKTSVTFDGVGLHSGAPVRMTVQPAPVHHGIWFRRTDDVAGDPFVPARWDAVTQAALCTLIENEHGVSISTIEHIMAALAGCGVVNALVEIDGPETPIMDGSSAVFVDGLLKAGLVRQSAERSAIRVLRKVEVSSDAGFARLEPAQSLSIDFAIDFADAAIGAQNKSLNMANGTFVRELCDSRTFCRNADVEAMLSQGLAQGGSL